MKRLFKTSAMKNLTRKIKTKRGATLVELIAVIAILSIVASLSVEAMYMAAEEYRRVRTVSESERSISLMQENIDLYAKNAVDIDFENYDTYPSTTNINDLLRDYKTVRVGRGSPLEDAENQPDDDYIDIVLYRSGDFTYTLCKYTNITGVGDSWEEILTVSNIKEINLDMKKLDSSYSDSGGTNATYMLDYAIMSPTGFEMIYSENKNLDVADAINSGNYSSNEGLYSVMSGTVINNIESWGGATADLRICENVPATSTTSAYNGTLNFVVIRTVPREAK